MKYLIDTDIASYFLRGKYNLADIFNIKGVTEIRLSVITVAQMEVLAYKNPYSKINLATISELTDCLGALDLNRETWNIFSMMKAETEKQGRPRGDLDVLQAAIAKQFGLILITHNVDHFEGLIEYEDWANYKN